MQVPQGAEPSAHGEQTRLAAVLTLLTGTPGVASAHALSEQELAELLKPGLGAGAERLAIPVPAVIVVWLPAVMVVVVVIAASAVRVVLAAAETGAFISSVP